MTSREIDNFILLVTNKLRDTFGNLIFVGSLLYCYDNAHYFQVKYFDKILVIKLSKDYIKKGLLNIEDNIINPIINKLEA